MVDDLELKESQANESQQQEHDGGQKIPSPQIIRWGLIIHRPLYNKGTI